MIRWRNRMEIELVALSISTFAFLGFLAYAVLDISKEPKKS